MATVPIPAQSDLAVSLIPDAATWQAARKDLALLIFGVDRASTPGASNSYTLRTSTAQHEVLNRAVVDAARLCFGDERVWSRTDTWDTIVAVLDAVSSEPPLDDEDVTAKHLFAAKVLLNLDLTPPDENAPLPGGSDGVTLADMRKEDGIASGVRFEDSVTLRRAYLTRLFGVTSVRAMTYQKAPKRAEAIAATLLNTVLTTMAAKVGPSPHNRGTDEPVAPTQSSEGHRPAARLPKHCRRRRSLLLLAGAFVIASVALVGWRLSWWAWAPWAPASDQVSIRNVTSPIKYAGERFWVPATAPIETLPVVENSCHGTDGNDQRMKAWLEQYATPQYQPQELVVRNLSRAEDLITLSEVTAHGETSDDVTPGFVIYCPSAGQGGDIDFAILKLALEDGAQAELQTKEPSTYLARTIGKGAATGLILHFDGEQDFHGTITAKVEQLDRTTTTATLPVGDSESGILGWHGIPSDKYLEVSPGAPGNGLQCATSPEPNAPASPCTPGQIQDRLDAVWGPGVVE